MRDPFSPARARGVKAVISEPADQQGHRKRSGSRGGRPVSLDAIDHKNHNIVARQGSWQGRLVSP